MVSPYEFPMLGGAMRDFYRSMKGVYVDLGHAHENPSMGVGWCDGPNQRLGLGEASAVSPLAALPTIAYPGPLMIL